MKRHFLFLALLLLVGAALWGVNWRLDHPPLTKADLEFRALVAGADSVYVSQYNDIVLPLRSTIWNPPSPVGSLNAEQTRELIDKMRFVVDKSDSDFNRQTSSNTFSLSFQRNDAELLSVVLWLPDESHPKGVALLKSPESPSYVYEANLRYHKRLLQYLNRVLPRRVRP